MTIESRFEDLDVILSNGVVSKAIGMMWLGRITGISYGPVLMSPFEISG